MPQDLTGPGATPAQDFIVELTSGSTYPATFGANGNAGVADATNANRRYPTWLQVVGAGTVTVVNEDGSSVPLVCGGGEVFYGTVKEITSSTATRVRLGTGQAPPSPPSGINVAPLNLAGGSSSVTGVLPGANVARFANGGVQGAAFTAAVGTMYSVNATGATFSIAMPAISSTNDGMAIGFANISTGSTATVLTPSGSDSVGQTGGTGATAAGPAAGLTAQYVADATNHKWLKF